MNSIGKRLLITCFSVCMLVTAVPVMGASSGVAERPANAVFDMGVYSWKSFWQGIFGGGGQSSKPASTQPQTEKSTEATTIIDTSPVDVISESLPPNDSYLSDTDPAEIEDSSSHNSTSGNASADASIEERIEQLESYKATSDNNIKQIDKEISNAVKRITSAEQLFDDVNKRLNDVSGSIGDISQRLNQVEEKVRNIGITSDGTSAVTVLSDRVKALEDTVNAMGGTSGSSSDMSAVAGRLAVLENRVQDIADNSQLYNSEQITDISNRLKTLESKLKNVEGRLSSVEGEESVTSGEALSVSSSLSQAKERIDELESEVEMLIQTSSREQKDIAAITLKLTEIETEIKSIDSGSSSGSASDIGRISGKIASMDADLAQVHKTISANADSMVKLTNRLSDAENEIGNASERLTSIEGRLLQGDSGSGMAAEKILAVEDELAGAVARIAGAEERLLTNEERISANEERLTSAETRLAQSDERFDDLDARINASDSKLSDEDMKISSLEKKIEEIEAQLEDLDANLGNKITYTDTSRYINVTTDFGDYNLDSTGYEDVSGKLNYILSELWDEVAGRTLFFPSGIYRFESPVVCVNDKVSSGKYQGRNAGVTFLGESQLGTEFRFNCSSGQVPLTFKNGHRIRLFSITFVNDNENPADMVFLQKECHDTFINDCRFLNCIRGLHITNSMYSYVYQTHFINGKGTGVSNLDCFYELWYEDGEYGYVENCSFEGKFNNGKGVGALSTNSLLLFFDKNDFCNWYQGSATQVRGEGGYSRGSGSIWYTNCIFMRNKKSIDLAATGNAKKGVYNISVSGCAFTTLNETRDAYVVYGPNRLVRGLRINDSYVYGSSETGIRIKLPDDFYSDMDNRDVCRLDLLIPNDTKITVEPNELKDKVHYESLSD